ncbi:MAG: serine hydrolase domain-containing protein [Candidatus Kapaibacterium sp.]|nr:MAG: serine hydrolase domain-containing protein [Candidatus Kapabacteria bacterium]
MALLLLLVTGCAMVLTPAYSQAQQLYFPPTTDTLWETVSFSELGWCPEHTDTLYSFLEATNSKAFIVLKNGRIAIEWYGTDFSVNKNWYWASAAKTITAVLVGMLNQDGTLDITRPTSDYLGSGWTSLPAEQEQNITLWHQLTMTTGLDDDVEDVDCTLPSCLTYKAEPGTRWAYHNAAYTMLHKVIEAASDQKVNTILNERLKSKTGMDGLFINSGYNNVMYSTARSMARFGLLTLANFTWNGQTVFSDSNYIRSMLNTSQPLNKSYGYLWWLNGKESFMVPRTQFVFKGSAVPNAPADMVSGLGTNNQVVSVIPSMNMVVVRMGNNAGDAESENSLVFVNNLWSTLRLVMCSSTAVQADESGHRYDFLVGQRTVPAGTRVVVVNVLGRTVGCFEGPDSVPESLSNAAISVSNVTGATRVPTVYMLVR